MFPPPVIWRHTVRHFDLFTTLVAMVMVKNRKIEKIDEKLSLSSQIEGGFTAFVFHGPRQSAATQLVN